MAAILPTLKSEAYTLDEALRNNAPSGPVYMPPPNEADREEMLLKKLGARGWGRMHQFRYLYQPEWGDSRCKPLSPRALEAFYRFIEAFQVPSSCVPSLFLTDGGGLELRWEVDGNDVQVEFSASGIEYYLPNVGVESWLAHSDALRLAQKLSQRP
jgi:hypothetical protein